MTAGSDRLKRALDICDQALALGAEERESFLASIDATDAELGKEVRSLLQAVEDSGSFLIAREATGAED